MEGDGSSCVWGTREELLLASAVRRHGSEDWERVSMELQARAMAHASFTAQDCRSKYYAIKRRYCNPDDMDTEVGNNMPWFEELRKVRVAHLRKELQHYDDSIRSLQIKLKRLKAESSVANPNHVTKIATTLDPFNSLKIEQAEDVGISSSKGQDGGMKLEPSMELKREPLDFIPLLDAPADSPSSVDVGDRRGKCINVMDIACAKCKQKEDSVMLSPNKGGPTGECDRNDLQSISSLGHVDACMANSDMVEAEFELRHNSKAKSTELPGTFSPIVSFQAPSDMIRQMEMPWKGKEKQSKIGNAKQTPNNWRGSLSHEDNGKSFKLQVQDDAGGCSYQDSDADCFQIDNFKAGIDGENHFKSNKENPSIHIAFKKSPQLNVSGNTDMPDIDPCQFKASPVDALVSVPAFPNFVNKCTSISFAKNDIHHDSEQVKSGDKRKHDKQTSGQLATEESGPSLSVGSADSTGHGGTNLKHGALSQDEKTIAKISGIIAGSQSPRSRGDMSNKSLRSEEMHGKNQRKKNVVLLEMSEESIEFVNSKEVSGTVEQSIKLNFKVSPTKDLGSACKDDSETTGSINPVKTKASIKAVSAMTSHERSGSINDEGNNIEGWQEDTERYSGDSQFEKSEAGSLMDGNEGISPMSSRHRREPKVLGKFLHLLNCLRTISAHKCALVFKHKQETQESIRYDRLIRSHVDLMLVRTRLEEGTYTGSMHFFRDLLLMVTNALVYYRKESQEYVAAIGLRECIRKEMSRVFQTEALLKQDRPSTRKRERRRPSAASALITGSASPGKQQGKRGRSRLKGSDHIISESVAQVGDGTAVFDRAGYYSLAADALHKKLQDTAEKKPRNLREMGRKAAGSRRASGKLQPGRCSSSVSAKGPKGSGLLGDRLRQGSKLHSGGVHNGGQSTTIRTPEKGVNCDAKPAAVVAHTEKGGHLPGSKNASDSQPAKRRVGRPPRQSITLQSIGGEERAAGQQKKKTTRLISQSY